MAQDKQYRSLSDTASYLDWEEGRAVVQVIPATQRRVLLPHVQLKVLEKIIVVRVLKRQQRANSTRHGRVEDALGPARRQDGLLQRQDGLSNVEVGQYVNLTSSGVR